MAKQDTSRNTWMLGKGLRNPYITALNPEKQCVGQLFDPVKPRIIAATVN